MSVSAYKTLQIKPKVKLTKLTPLKGRRGASLSVTRAEAAITFVRGGKGKEAEGDGSHFAIRLFLL